MDDSGVNIDIVFRNGLKDYEVLPPQDVWNNIRPVIRKKQQPFIVLRTAAMIAVALSLSFLAYKFSREISIVPENPGVALNTETVSPAPFITAAILPDEGAARDQMLDYNISIPDNRAVIPVTTDNIVATVQDVINTSGSDDLKDIGSASARPMALNYGRTSYIDFGEEEALDVPDNTARKEPDRWSISALISPTYQSRFSSGGNEAVAHLMASEKTVISYSGGLALSYKINKRFSVQSGLYYTSVGKELSGISAYSGFEKYFYSKGEPSFVVATANGTVYTNNNDIFLTDGLYRDRIQTNYNSDVFDPGKASLTYLDNALRQNFSYLELPVILRYKIIDKALDFNIIGGLSSNLLINNSVYASSDGNRYTVGDTKGLNTITFSSSLGMGMEYSFSGNISLNLEPTFRYYMNPFNNIPGMKIHPYSFGVFSGITYKF